MITFHRNFIIINIYTILQDAEQKAFYLKVGRAIRSVREELKVKQGDLAEQLGLNRVSISNIETGKQRIQLHTLVEIAAYFQLPLGKFLPATETESSELNSRLEKKLSNTEIASSAEAVDRVRTFVTSITTPNTAKHVSRPSSPRKNRAKSG